jgi:putative FmdB family regulatory protein
MPIYAYKCASCGHAKDVLQKLSDAPLTVCPACGAESFSKQVTAAGFQLKGSGWYATDFRNGSAAPAPAAGDKAETAAKPADGAAKTGDTKPAESSPAPTKTDAPSASAGGRACAVQ